MTMSPRPSSGTGRAWRAHQASLEPAGVPLPLLLGGGMGCRLAGSEDGGLPRRHRGRWCAIVAGKVGSAMVTATFGHHRAQADLRRRRKARAGLVCHQWIAVPPRAPPRPGEPAGQPANPPGQAVRPPGSRSRPGRSGPLRRPLVARTVLTVVGVLAAGCGSSDGSGSAGSGYGGSGSASPTSSPTGQSGVATVAATSTKLGTILVDGSGRTLYLLAKDQPDQSAGACAGAWPVDQTSGAPKAGNGVKPRCWAPSVAPTAPPRSPTTTTRCTTTPATAGPDSRTARPSTPSAPPGTWSPPPAKRSPVPDRGRTGRRHSGTEPRFPWPR